MSTASPPFVPAFRGTFYRAADPRFREYATSGSRSVGRYSRAGEPTLYLSSSLEGVEAALIAHGGAGNGAGTPSREILEIEVEASGIIDLRDAAAVDALGLDLADAIAPWQDLAASGGTPPSWAVRDRLIAAGAHGLIDPSRQRPGLWHLVLFRWNVPGAPAVSVRTR